MTKPSRKKTEDNLLEYVRQVRAATGLTEGEFAHELGLPKPTLKAMCNPKSNRRASDEHLSLILLSCGAEFPGNPHFTEEDYAKWRLIHDMPLPQIRSLIDATLANAETLLAGAASKKRLLVALYLFETQLRKWMQHLDLTDDITAAESGGGVASSLSQPEKITREVLRECIETSYPRS